MDERCKKVFCLQRRDQTQERAFAYIGSEGYFLYPDAQELDQEKETRNGPAAPFAKTRLK